MGDSGQVSVDTMRLDAARQNLNDQRERVLEARKQLADPVGGMFGGSSRGEWLGAVVRKGHQNIDSSLGDTAKGLHETSEAIHDAMVAIEGADVDAAVTAQKFANALALMSNPLVIFNKNQGPGKYLAI
ncbi:hypothetical protein NBCG_00724 [Nocardioidaceae bacterium Broad-1]|nr:hypothetical protein NBCG_00724 [Nocardioidaceae bacterium Broad-1]